MENKFETFAEILRGSKRYEIKGSVLTITGYYTGKEVKLDLSRLDEEVFNELLVTDEDEEYEDEF